MPIEDETVIGTSPEEAILLDEGEEPESAIGALAGEVPEATNLNQTCFIHLLNTRGIEVRGAYYAIVQAVKQAKAKNIGIEVAFPLELIAATGERLAFDPEWIVSVREPS